MGITMANNSVEYLHAVLAQIQDLYAHGSTGKHQQIRLIHWVRKLRSQPTSNPTWLKSVLEYANVLLQMLVDGVTEEPFTKMPPQGPLPALPRHQVVRLAKRLVRVRPQQQTHGNSDKGNNNSKDVGVVTVVQRESKQIQTQEQDDQWEWQRVWKGAFDKMHHKLQSKSDETEALATENKVGRLNINLIQLSLTWCVFQELRTLIEGYKKALDEAERNQRDIQAKHLAEIENLRAVHSLEVSNLKARHRQKLQEATLQNDEKLLKRREIFSGQPRNDTENNADFLQYIDNFYSATLRITAQNKV